MVSRHYGNKARRAFWVVHLEAMMMVPGGVKVHLALGYTDMRKGLDGLAMLVQEDPLLGHLFAFRGKGVSILKTLFWDD